MMKLVILLILFCGNVLGDSYDDFLKLVAQVESVNDPTSVGDNGQSLGLYQIGKAAWTDVSKVRRAKGLPTIDWRTGAHSRHWSKVYAKDHAKHLARSLSGRLGKHSQRLVYAAWNAGLTRVVKAKGILSKLPQRTQDYCSIFPTDPLPVE